MILHVNEDSKLQLFTANGVIETAKVKTNNNKLTILSTVIVAKDMSHTALISWHDLINLKIIPSRFPALVAQLTVSPLKDEVIAKKLKVFQDSH